MKKRFTFLLGFIHCLLIRAQFNQDTQFNQYNLVKTSVNPGFTGSDSAFGFASAYSIDKSRTAYHFSIDNYFHAIRGGLGIRHFSENQSMWDSKISATCMSYAAHLELFKHKLVVQPGVEVFYYQNSYETPGYSYFFNNQLIFSNAVSHNYSYWSIGAGLLFYSKKFYGGVALYNLTKPRVTDEEINYRFGSYANYHVGWNLQLGKFTVSPNVLFSAANEYRTSIIGVNGKYKWIVLGVHLEEFNFFILNGGLQNEFFRLGYSYLKSFQFPVPNERHQVYLIFFIPHNKPSAVLSLRLI